MTCTRSWTQHEFERHERQRSSTSRTCMCAIRSHLRFPRCEPFFANRAFLPPPLNVRSLVVGKKSRATLTCATELPSTFVLHFSFLCCPLSPRSNLFTLRFVVVSSVVPAVFPASPSPARCLSPITHLSLSPPPFFLSLLSQSTVRLSFPYDLSCGVREVGGECVVVWWWWWWCVEVADSASPCVNTLVCAKHPRVSNMRTFGLHTREHSQCTHISQHTQNQNNTRHRTPTTYSTHINKHEYTKHTGVPEIHRPRQHANAETHTSNARHITITRSGIGHSTRVHRVMLITSFGSHGSRVSASFAVNFGTVLHSLFSTLLQFDVRIPGLLLDCAVISLMMCKCFFSKPSLVCMPHHDSQQLVCCLRVVKFLGRRLRRVKSAKMFVPLGLVVVWTRKVVSGNTPSGGKDAQTAVRRPPHRICGEVVNLRQNCTKRLLAGLGELLLSVT